MTFSHCRGLVISLKIYDLLGVSISSRTLIVMMKQRIYWQMVVLDPLDKWPYPVYTACPQDMARSLQNRMFPTSTVLTILVVILHIRICLVPHHHSFSLVLRSLKTIDKTCVYSGCLCLYHILSRELLFCTIFVHFILYVIFWRHFVSVRFLIQLSVKITIMILKIFLVLIYLLYILIVS